ncbi:MAG: small multi-drug export protein [Dehalococcoidales bacterium]|nr:small multi-drug export protein [Dehalococcoidales bacterium]
MSPEELLSLGLPRELVVLIIAALPIFELRGALPVAINLFHFPWYYALLLAIIGNLVPVPILLLVWGGLVKLLSRISVFERAFNWLIERTKRQGKVIEKYRGIGLALFVAVPLPMTGAWTGALAANIFGLRFGSAFLSIALGVFVAGAIVTSLCLLGWIGAVIVGIGLSGLITFALWKRLR